MGGGQDVAIRRDDDAAALGLADSEADGGGNDLLDDVADACLEVEELRDGAWGGGEVLAVGDGLDGGPELDQGFAGRLLGLARRGILRHLGGRKGRDQEQGREAGGDPPRHRRNQRRLLEVHDTDVMRRRRGRFRRDPAGGWANCDGTLPRGPTGKAGMSAGPRMAEGTGFARSNAGDGHLCRRAQEPEYLFPDPAPPISCRPGRRCRP